MWACQAITYSILSCKWHSFHAEVIDHKMCVLIFSKILSENSLILRRIQQEIFLNLHQSSCNHVKYLLCLSDFNETWFSLTDFWKKFHGNTPNGSWVFLCRQSDIQIRPDTTKLIVSFHTFVNAPDNHYTLVFVIVLYKKVHGQLKKKLHSYLRWMS